MAVNYSVKQVLNVLRGDDLDAIHDVMNRYSFVALALAKADAVSHEVTDSLVAMIPVNARKANKTLSEGGDGYADVEPESDDAELEEKSATKKSEEKPAHKPEHEDDGSDNEDGGYGAMKAKDLYDLCVKRGIAVEPRHRTKYYIDLLEKADAEKDAPAAADADEDDDWDI